MSTTPSEWEQVDEYETDSDGSDCESWDDSNDYFLLSKDELAIPRLRETTVLRSGRTLRASVSLGL